MTWFMISWLTIQVLTGVNQSIHIDTRKVNTVRIMTAGDYVATFVAECNLRERLTDGEWIQIRLHSLPRYPVQRDRAYPPVVTSFTQGKYDAQVAGCYWMRVRSTSWTQGTATIQLEGVK